MKTIIHFVRHGKTNNPKHIVKGLLPGFLLTKQAKKETAKLGKFLRGKKINRIYFSPTQRTKQTAKIIRPYLPASKLKSDKRLIEWQTDWEGYTIEQIKKNPALHWKKYLNDPLHFRTKKGQTASQVTKQMMSFCKEIIKKYQGEEIVAVSHGDPIKLLRCYLKTGEISKKFISYKCSQPSITSFSFIDKKLKKIIYKSYIKNQNYFLQ